MTKKPLPDFETWPKQWQENGWNNCLISAPFALEYLAKYERPIGGEEHYNAAHLTQLAEDIRRTLDALAAYNLRREGEAITMKEQIFRE